MTGESRGLKYDYHNKLEGLWDDILTKEAIQLVNELSFKEIGDSDIMISDWLITSHKVVVRKRAEERIRGAQKLRMEDDLWREMYWSATEKNQAKI